MKDRLRCFQIPKNKIVEFNFILAGYEGMGIVRTIDKDRGIIEVLLAPGFEKDFDRLLSQLASEFQATSISASPQGIALDQTVTIVHQKRSSMMRAKLVKAYGLVSTPIARNFLTPKKQQKKNRPR